MHTQYVPRIYIIYIRRFCVESCIIFSSVCARNIRLGQPTILHICVLCCFFEAKRRMTLDFLGVFYVHQHSRHHAILHAVFVWTRASQLSWRDDGKKLSQRRRRQRRLVCICVFKIVYTTHIYKCSGNCLERDENWSVEWWIELHNLDGNCMVYGVVRGSGFMVLISSLLEFQMGYMELTLMSNGLETAIVRTLLTGLNYYIRLDQAQRIFFLAF